MKKIHLLILVLLTFIMLLGCDSNLNEHTFYGEGINWKAEYVYSYNGDVYNSELLLFYNGEEKEVKECEYTLKWKHGDISKLKGFDIKRDEWKSVSKSGGKGTIINKNEILTITIYWDNFEESIDLKVE
ncbi:MAG TPA: hypothetical protein PLW61_00680 [Caldisericia bacterium]|nr:hypothetical protein [Caldisericia bacterium]HOC52278.1 hypothetical protein [Caldisericia bacterium]HPB33271.1 hypothetical protein [Caldisericia bacterium]HQJ57428.1 hypothetical protein [Caldisericia bacterium]HQL66413.1 hypothetical protein [Caldisericia bacterium]